MLNIISGHAELLPAFLLRAAMNHMHVRNWLIYTMVSTVLHSNQPLYDGSSCQALTRPPVFLGTHSRFASMLQSQMSAYAHEHTAPCADMSPHRSAHCPAAMPGRRAAWYACIIWLPGLLTRLRKRDMGDLHWSALRSMAKNRSASSLQRISMAPRSSSICY